MALSIVAESHLDHGLSPAHVAEILSRFAGRDAFFVETFELPTSLPALMSGLHGPLAGDAPVPESECVRVVRGTRPAPSRMVARPARPTRLCTVVAGPGDAGEPCVLYTAFGGPSAPREPFGLEGADLTESEAFWAQHALSL